MQVFDKLGNEITEGCYITYGHALGRCAALRIGKVLKITEHEKQYGEGVEYHFTVWGVEDERGWMKEDDEPILCEKKGTLLFADRIIVLKEEMLPEKYLKCLKMATMGASFKSLGLKSRWSY